MNRRYATYLLFIVVIFYAIYQTYIGYICMPSNTYIYDNLSVEFKYIFKLIYVILTYSLFNLILYIYNPTEYKLNEKLINRIIFVYLIISEIGLYFEVLKSLIY